MYLVYAQLGCHLPGRRVCIAGEHNGLFDALRLQAPNGLGRVLLHHIAQEDKTGIDAVYGHIYHGSGLLRLCRLNVQLLHEPPVAHSHSVAVHLRRKAEAAQLLHIRHPVGIHPAAPSRLQALADGVSGVALRLGRPAQQGLRVHPLRGRLQHLKNALGQGARLVEHHAPGLSQGLQVVAALDQNPLGRRAADAAEKAQGNADDQGAGAADDQEGQGSCDPVTPQGCIAHSKPHHRRQHRQSQGTVAHRRGIDPGKLGDKVLRLGLFHAGIFHQVQDLGHGGVAEFLSGPDMQQAAEVHAAGEHLVPGLHLPGQALAGKGTGIHRRLPLGHHAVNGDALPGLHHDDGAHGHIIRVHLLQGAAGLDVGIVRTNIHQVGDAAAALTHGVALEQLAHLVKHHNGTALPPIAQGHSAHGGHSHKEILIEHLPPENALHSLK